MLQVCDALAACTFNTCSGRVRIIAFSPNATEIGASFQIDAPNPNNVTICNAIASSTTAGFIIYKSHPKYSEIISSLQIAAAIGSTVSVIALASPGNTCQAGFVTFAF